MSSQNGVAWQHQTSEIMAACGTRPAPVLWFREVTVTLCANPADTVINVVQSFVMASKRVKSK
jgi:hypothetical protein